MKQPLLSICIPTYNRCEYLAKSIESIIIQEEFLNGMVEIVISDNASDDDTQKVGMAYAEKYENISYYRNSENVRDINFPIVLSEAKGILKRLSNDTVLYQPGALSHMCRIIEENRKEKPVLFWSNGHSKRNEELQKVDFGSFVCNASYWITSIVCFSIWKDDCENIKNDISGCELCLWQVRKVLELASKRENILICNKTITDVQIVKKKNISYGLYKVFYENYFTLLTPYFDNYTLTTEDREYLEKDLLFNFFTEWCLNWEIQVDGLQYSKTEDLKQAIFEQYKNKPYWNEYLKEYNKKLWKNKIVLKIKKLLGRS